MHWNLKLERAVCIQDDRTPTHAWKGKTGELMLSTEAGWVREECSVIASPDPEEPRELHSHLRLKLRSEDKLEDWMWYPPYFLNRQALLSRQSKWKVYFITDKSWGETAHVVLVNGFQQKRPQSGTDSLIKMANDYTTIKGSMGWN